MSCTVLNWRWREPSLRRPYVQRHIEWSAARRYPQSSVIQHLPQQARQVCGKDTHPNVYARNPTPEKSSISDMHEESTPVKARRALQRGTSGAKASTATALLRPDGPKLQAPQICTLCR